MKALRLGALLLIVVTLVLALAGTAGATSNLSVSPTEIVFSPTTVGQMSSAVVTVTNNGTDTEELRQGQASLGFYPNLTGSCESMGWLLPAGQSCTVQPEFRPTKPGMQRGFAIYTFRNVNTLTNTDLTVKLKGRASPR